MAKADWCHRSTYYRISGAKTKEPDKGYGFVLENIFAEGNFIHLKWQEWLAQTGKLWGTWRCRVCLFEHVGLLRDHSEPGCPWNEWNEHDWEYREVQLRSDSHRITGMEDGAMDDYLIEFKSVGLGSLRMEAPNLLSQHYVKIPGGRGVYDLDTIWKDLRRPLGSHVRQVNVYMWLAAQMGLPFSRTAVVYEFKINQQVKEFTVRPSPEVIDPLLAKALEVVRALDSGVPPACTLGGCAQCRAYEGAAGD